MVWFRFLCLDVRYAYVYGVQRMCIMPQMQARARMAVRGWAACARMWALRAEDAAAGWGMGADRVASQAHKGA